MRTDLAQPWTALAELSDRHHAVMELVCEDFAYKEIAHRLKISTRTVEQRMSSVRLAIGTHDRASTARAYRQFKLLCGQTTCGTAPLAFVDQNLLPPFSDAGTDPVFTLSDAAFSGAEWVGASPAEYRPRVDDSWGRVYRFGIIVLIALGIAASLALVFAAADGLNDLL